MSRARDFADLAGSADAGGLTGRNLLINGAQTVAQRSTSVTGKTSSGYFVCDRWQTLISSAGTWSLSQSTTVPSGQGFAYSFKYDCTTADASLASSDYVIHRQNLEGQDLQRLGYGASGAQTVTLSFWVRSNKTGTYVCELRKYDDTRHNGGTYTINSADTWEHKTVSFSGDTASALVNSNAGGIKVHFWLAAGSSYTSGTLPSSWASNTTANQAAGQTVNLADSTSNEWYITGVQLEVGSATPFEHRTFADELARCQRYYQKHGNETTAYRFLASAFCNTTTQAQGVLTLPVTMRAAPTASVSGNFEMIHKNLNSSITLGTKQLNESSVGLEPSGSSFTQSSGAIIRASNDATAQLKLDAEL